jgi:hypothetical protein
MPAQNKQVKSALMLFAFGGVICLTVYGAAYLARQQSTQTTANETSCAQITGAEHRVTIHKARVSPTHTDASLCDKLTITNLDNTSRLMAFGQHDSHKPYHGIEERLLTKGQSFTVKLDHQGNFRFHDHFDDAVQGTFSVH